MSKTVKGYLRELKNLYWAKSEEVEKKYNELKSVQEEMTKVQTSRDYTPEGRSKRLATLGEKRDTLKKELNALREATNNEAMKIRENAETEFYNYYNASPDDVDLRLTELIRSGVLTDAELIHYGNKANATMRRLIGKELEGRSSYDAKQAGRAFQLVTNNPHLQAIDNIIGVGDYAVGGAKMGGFATVSSIRARFDSLIDPVINGVKDVKSEYLADGRQLFSVEGSAGYDG